METRKAHKNTEKAVTSVKLRILDDFNRRQMDLDFTVKADKASRAAKQLMTLSAKTRTDNHSHRRDEKIRLIRINQAREVAIEQDREMKRIRKEEEEANARL